VTDHWAQWPADGPDFADAETADLGDPPPDYAVEGFGPAGDDFTDTDLPDGEADGDAPEPGPLGYGDVDEPVSADPDAAPGPPAAESGMGPADGSPPGADVGFGSADAPIGADPDVDPYRDADSWPEPAFPGITDFGPPPEPVDGFPWTDPATLGSAAAESPADPAGLPPDPVEPAELADYAGEEPPAEVDPWSRLAASDDPATGALARFWSPGAG
jgi:hypothetical protein